MMEVSLGDFLQAPILALLVFMLLELRKLDRRIARIEGWLMRNGYSPPDES